MIAIELIGAAVSDQEKASSVSTRGWWGRRWILASIETHQDPVWKITPLSYEVEPTMVPSKIQGFSILATQVVLFIV